MTYRSPTFVGHLIGASFGLVFVLVNATGRRSSSPPP